MGGEEEISGKGGELEGEIAKEAISRMFEPILWISSMISIVASLACLDFGFSVIANLPNVNFNAPSSSSPSSPSSSISLLSLLPLPFTSVVLSSRSVLEPLDSLLSAIVMR